MIAYIVFLPLLAALIVGLNSRTLPVWLAQTLTTGALFASAILSGFVFYETTILKHVTLLPLFTWIDSADLHIAWALKVDSLTAVMLIVVTWVSALVHLYSIGYMHHDPHIQRFMAYLSLFTFFMLMLVTSDNFVQLFLGWEGVGLCSYLLIGFWFKKPSANAAAMKAFLVNRIGDFGFALGIFAIFALFGSVEFATVFSKAPEMQHATFALFGMELHALTVIALLLFIGCMGKSAQLGLHTWLPDAMEGPTPVSALIHAATMVTAGVFLVARSSPLFEYAPIALSVITLVGAATAIFAASIALTQNDIKRVIAYSTCSQLGYMFFACGVSAYSAAIFHLMTHAFFKALLFLGAGSVIHALSDEQDIRRMGGIARKIPATHVLMWIGSLALAGIFPFAGFYSKDIILEASYAAGGSGRVAFWVGIGAAFLTAFYSWRLLALVFYGKPRASHHAMEHAHESPFVMILPLILLAIGAIGSGFLGQHIFHMVAPEGDFWNGALLMLKEPNILEEAHHVPSFVPLLPTIIAIFAILLALLLYLKMKNIPHNLSTRFSALHRFLLNKWYIDELYETLFVRPTRLLAYLLWKIIDVRIIDGLAVNGTHTVIAYCGRYVSRLQNGYLYTYALFMVLGLLALVGFVIRSYLL